jgi:nucleotide-binding universal stress UspA family protein
MLTIKKILLPTDFSAGAMGAGAYARALAHAAGAELHVIYADVLHADSHAGVTDYPKTPESARVDLERLTAEAAARDQFDLDVKHAVARNISAAPAILEYAGDHDVDVIVMGTHGRRGVRRLLLGSVAEEVVRVSQCPVLTVRQPSEVPPMHVEIGSILVPIDFSIHSRNALHNATELARLFKSRLDLLHVVEETLHPAFYGITVQSIYDVHPDIEERALAQMRGLVESTDVPATFEARPGSAANGIVEYAAERGSGLVVMGTHGLTGLDHFIMGSTTERVLRRAPCPVFSVKSFGKSLIESK